MLGFSLSVSGIQVGMRRLNVAANNIANSTTPSFKASRVDSVDIRSGGASGTVQVNFNPGPIEGHEGRFSLAVEGEGFFRVGTPQGERYTRAGAFQIDGAGNIVTSEGYPLLPGFQVPPETQALQVGPDGTVAALLPDGETQEIGRIDLARFANVEGLSQEAGGLYSATAASGAPIGGFAGEGGLGNLVFGAVEGSNVDLASEMISLIVSKAAVQANIATLKAQDEVLGTIIDLRS